MSFKTPIAYFIFNRPDLTAITFEAIREIRPTMLFVIADGPRNDLEKSLTNAARSIVDKIDWPCKVYKNYAETNMGCKDRISSGITWFFETVEQGIILEDDCLPHPDFFPFCEELLNRYKHSETIYHIGGTCLFDFEDFYSYHYTNHTYIWGWATWRRAWRRYDVQMKCWPDAKEKMLLQKKFRDKNTADYWEAVFESVFRGSLNTWDYQWLFTCWLNNGFSIGSSKNLISNIGFRADATHTHHSTMPGSALEMKSMPEIMHPPIIQINGKYDSWVFNNIFMGGQKSEFHRVSNRILSKLRSILRT